MRRSSKILLIVAGMLLVLLAAIYIPVFTASQPQLNEEDANQLLERLARALVTERTDEVLEFASEDAVVAGRNLKQIREMLQRGFAYARHLEVTFTDVQYRRTGETVVLDTKTNAVEMPPESRQPTQTYYSHPVRFTLQRRATPQLFGLLKTYEWKITAVDAPGLPTGSEGI